MSGVDHVIYGIGLPEQFQFDDGVFDRVNCQLLQTFLEALASSGVRRLTYISTYEVFEVIDNDIDETHPIADESDDDPLLSIDGSRLSHGGRLRACARHPS